MFGKPLTLRIPRVLVLHRILRGGGGGEEEGLDVGT